MKKVLAVEGQDWLHNRWRNELSLHSNGQVKLISALSVDEAAEKFMANHDLDAIVIDADIGDGAILLVEKFREIFTTGPMIAIAKSEIGKRALVCAGCNYEAGTKESVPRKLLGIFGL